MYCVRTYGYRKAAEERTKRGRYSVFLDSCLPAAPFCLPLPATTVAAAEESRRKKGIKKTDVQRHKKAIKGKAKAASRLGKAT